MEGDLCERSLQFHPGVPCTTSGVVEARSVRGRGAEGRVDNVSLRCSKQQLTGTDRDVFSLLGQLALVGCGIKLSEIGDDFCWERERFKNTAVSIRVFR